MDKMLQKLVEGFGIDEAKAKEVKKAIDEHVAKATGKIIAEHNKTVDDMKKEAEAFQRRAVKLEAEVMTMRRKLKDSETAKKHIDVVREAAKRKIRAEKKRVESIVLEAAEQYVKSKIDEAKKSLDEKVKAAQLVLDNVHVLKAFVDTVHGDDEYAKKLSEMEEKAKKAEIEAAIYKMASEIRSAVSRKKFIEAATSLETVDERIIKGLKEAYSDSVDKAPAKKEVKIEQRKDERRPKLALSIKK